MFLLNECGLLIKEVCFYLFNVYKMCYDDVYLYVKCVNNSVKYI